MEVQSSHGSAFARFSDKLKSTARRKPSTTPPVPPDIMQPPVDMDRRRSSVANYAAAIRQIFTPSPSLIPDLGSPISTLPTELLTQIFLCLDMWTLLRCQLVCKRWRNMIPGTSPLLSEALYLAPSHNLAIYTSIHAAFELAILKHPHMPGSSVKSGFPEPGEKWPWTLGHWTKAQVRMSSEFVFHPVILDWDLFVPKLAVKFGKAEMALKKKQEEEGGFRRKESFEDMLVSMPPLQEIVLNPAWPTTEAASIVLRVEEGKVGITLGNLFATMEEWARLTAYQDSVPLD